MRAFLVLFALLPALLVGCTGSRRAATTPVPTAPVAAVPIFVEPPGGVSAAASRPSCEALTFDLRTGLLNGVAPTASMDEVKGRFPCWTGETEEGHAFNNGGGVFYIDHDMYFYTHRDYIEVRESFAGTVTPALMGAGREALEAALGAPARTLRYEGGGSFGLYATAYGCLGAQFTREDRVDQLNAYDSPCAEVQLGS